VLTVKLGFIDTPMTAHLSKNFLYASPKAAAKGIYKAIEADRNVLYQPWF